MKKNMIRNDFKYAKGVHHQSASWITSLFVVEDVIVCFWLLDDGLSSLNTTLSDILIVYVTLFKF